MSEVVDAAPRRSRSVGLRVCVALGVVLAAVALDQVSKAWALATLETGRARPLIGDVLTLQLVHNSGAAFSLGAGATWVFTVLATCVVVAIIWVLPRTEHMPTLVALCLLAGGAIGNLIDRLVQPPSFGQGHVVDFINYGGLFVGNVADIWIVGAAVWLAVIYAFGLHGTGSDPLGDTARAGSGTLRPTPTPTPTHEGDDEAEDTHRAEDTQGAEVRRADVHGPEDTHRADETHEEGRG
ncbi:signal peptidase II [Actinomyces polynesiensis]|uniref:signal peptidase II n=1 Tax=Actinomyces polynesiensis TaxID=1325934 RepID=UPI001E599EDB|nr:signal peptidase II [Actinomyces polynesiensis]